ncbi:MAG: VCBS repeat-containing protein, partial [Proteobacteria bacterium]|nr:VCBS repeat-containing protein [Pseudomonadota bacterium]
MSSVLLALACTDAAVDSGSHSDPPIWTPDPVVLEVTQDLDVIEYDGTFPGLALGDLDGDTDLDLVISVPRERTLIYWNSGGVLSEGLTLPESVSPALGDLDQDGDLDLVLAGEGQDSIWWNLGDRFAQELLTGSGGISFSVALFDKDGDDDLDIAIARYPDAFTPEDVVDGSLVGPGNSLYENQAGALVEVGLPADVGDVTFLFKPFDADSDGDLDLLQCNDFGPFLEPSRLLRNEGGSFVATDHVLDTYAMGATVSDVDRDGQPDVYVTDIGGPDLMLAGWIEAAASFGVDVPAGERLTSWGTAFVDLDLDGDDDLATVFGPLEPGGADLSGLGIDDSDPAEQADLVLVRDGETFSEVITGFEDTHANRTLVVGDLDRDGA